jgi:hypothetical protein
MAWLKFKPTSIPSPPNPANVLKFCCRINWDRMSSAGAQLMTWFGVACELHRDWRNDVEGLGTLFSNHIPDC